MGIKLYLRLQLHVPEKVSINTYLVSKPTEMTENNISQVLRPKSDFSFCIRMYHPLSMTP